MVWHTVWCEVKWCCLLRSGEPAGAVEHQWLGLLSPDRHESFISIAPAAACCASLRGGHDKQKQTGMLLLL
jgi:hypothetical protein